MKLKVDKLCQNMTAETSMKLNTKFCQYFYKDSRDEITSIPKTTNPVCLICCKWEGNVSGKWGRKGEKNVGNWNLCK